MIKHLRRAALILCLALACAPFTGCTRQTASENAQEQAEPVPIYPIQTDEALTYWMLPSSSRGSQYENFGETPIAKEIEKRTGVKVEFLHPQPGQSDEEFNQMLAAGTLPDLVERAWNNFPGGADKAIEDNYIYDLTEALPEWAPAFSALMSENPEWARQTKSSGGLYYALPFIKGGDKLVSTSGLAVRRDWLDKAGLEMPETIDEWETALIAFKDQFGAKRALTGVGTRVPFLNAYNLGAEFFLDGGTVKYTPFENAYKDFLERFASWYEMGLIDPGIASIDTVALDSAMLNNEVGVVYTWAGSGLGKWITAKESAANADPDFALAAAAYPVLNKGSRPEFGVRDANVIMSSSVAVSKNCKNPELAVRYLDYGYTQEGNILFNFGIEGESFTWIDGYPTYTALILDNPAHMLGAYTRAAYSGAMVQRSEQLEQSYRLQEQRDALEIWSATNMGEHFLPDIAVSEADLQRYNEIYDAAAAYADEMYIKFLTGKEPLEGFDAYRQRLIDLGIEELLALKQAAYDRYLTR